MGRENKEQIHQMIRVSNLWLGECIIKSNTLETQDKTLNQMIN